MISVKVDISSAIARLNDIERRQIPYAMKNAINDTLTEFQSAMQAGIAARFTLRKTDRILSTVKIARGNFATKTKMSGSVTMGGSEDKRSIGNILNKFEDGKDKESLDPYTPIAVPTRELRRSPAEVIPLEMFPKNLRLVDRKGIEKTMPAKIHITKRGVEQIKGKRRTFVLDPGKHSGAKMWGVWQRYGKERGQIRLLWIYKMKVKIPKRLQFAETAQRVVPGSFMRNFKRTLADALRTAR